MRIGYSGFQTKILFFSCEDCSFSDDTVSELLSILEIGLKILAQKKIKFELYKTEENDEIFYRTNEIDGYFAEFVSYATSTTGKAINSFLYVPDDKIFYLEVGMNDNLKNGYVHPYLISHNHTDAIFREIKNYLKASNKFKFKEIFTIDP